MAKITTNIIGGAPKGMHSMLVSRRPLGVSISDYERVGETPPLVLDNIERFYAHGGVQVGGYQDLVTFSRTGSATYFNNGGEGVSAADGVPRIGSYLYKGGKWVDAGQRLEGLSRENMITQSEDLSLWSMSPAGSLDVTDDQALGPDGNQSLSRLEIPRTNDEAKRIFRDDITVVINDDYAVQFVASADELQYVGFRIYGASSEWVVVVFDLLNGTVTQESEGPTSGTVSLSGIHSIGNGLYHGWFVCSIGDSVNENILIALHSNGTPTLGNSTGDESWVGAVGDGLPIGFVSMEQGSMISSYSQTSGSTATRGAETATINSSKMPWPLTPAAQRRRLVETFGWTITDGGSA